MSFFLKERRDLKFTCKNCKMLKALQHKIYVIAVCVENAIKIQHNNIHVY